MLERPSKNSAQASPFAMSVAERERLWRAFRVPVFEQIIAPDGELLAAECEAHDGLHIEISGLPWDGYRLERAACGCGRSVSVALR